MADIQIRPARPADAPAIAEIQNALLTTTAIEWTTTPHTADERRAWLVRQEAMGYPVLVAVDGRSVLGWASYAEFRDTAKWPGYRFTVEHTIHVAQDAWGRGIGRRLMDALCEAARAAGMHVMVGAVDGENRASLDFHARLGFVEVARMPQVGEKFGRWLDLVLLQKQLDGALQPPIQF